jgi:hypothetical protein
VRFHWIASAAALTAVDVGPLGKQRVLELLPWAITYEALTRL